MSFWKASGIGNCGQGRLAELELDLGPLGYPQRVVACGGHLGEEAPHLLRALQVVLLALELEALRVVDRGAGLHAQQGVMGDRVLAPAVVAVVGGDQRGVERRAMRMRPGLVLRWASRPWSCSSTKRFSLPKMSWSRPGQADRSVEVVGEEGLGHDASQAPGRRDEAFVMALQQLPVDTGLVVVTLEDRRPRRA